MQSTLRLCVWISLAALFPVNAGAQQYYYLAAPAQYVVGYQPLTTVYAAPVVTVIPQATVLEAAPVVVPNAVAVQPAPAVQTVVPPDPPKPKVPPEG